MKNLSKLSFIVILGIIMTSCSGAFVTFLDVLGTLGLIFIVVIAIILVISFFND